MLDIKKFRQNADDAVIWCTHRLKTELGYANKQILRSVRDDIPDSYFHLSHNELIQYADEVFERRRRFIKDNPETFSPAINIGQSYQQGKLFVLFATKTTSDGTLNIETYGLFDNDNFPPIDTWIYYTVDAEGEMADLIAWIPSSFVQLVNTGIESCADLSVDWLDSPESFAANKQYVDDLKENQLLV